MPSALLPDPSARALSQLPNDPCDRLIHDAVLQSATIILKNQAKCDALGALFKARPTIDIEQDARLQSLAARRPNHLREIAGRRPIRNHQSQIPPNGRVARQR